MIAAILLAWAIANIPAGIVLGCVMRVAGE